MSKVIQIVVQIITAWLATRNGRANPSPPITDNPESGPPTTPIPTIPTITNRLWTFEKCVAIVLDAEGGFVDHPDDPGGKTKYGITAAQYPELDIEQLTIDDAIDIYERDYWLRFKCHEMHNRLRLAFFDCCVNQGGPTANRLLQDVIGTHVDGIFGPQSKIALDQMVMENGDEYVLEKFLRRRNDHYFSLTKFTVFGKGWVNRLLDVARHSGRIYDDEQQHDG